MMLSSFNLKSSRRYTLLTGAVGVALSMGALVAHACPACRVAAAGLADGPGAGARPHVHVGDETASCCVVPHDEQTPVSAVDFPSDGAKASTPIGPFTLALGSDFTNAYFHRGYLQQDEGFVVQPFLVLSTTLVRDPVRQLVVRPYLGWWNSFQDGPSDGARFGHGGSPKTVTKQKLIWEEAHPGMPYRHYHVVNVTEIEGGTGQGWYETDLMAGVTVNWRDWTLDLQYHAHIFPSGPHDAVQEIGAKLSYDIASIVDDRPITERPFSLTASVGVWRELKDDNGSEETYVELSIEPSWRTKVGAYQVGIGLPVLVGSSPDGYYTTAELEDQTWGYLSVGVKVSVLLPIPRNFGRWYVNTSVTYLNLLAESARFANGGEPHEWIGSVGLGVQF